MARHTDPSVLRLGAISLVPPAGPGRGVQPAEVPGFKGIKYHAQLTDASGLHKGNMVQVAGVKVGRIDKLHISGDHVTVDFDVKGATLGKKSRAGVQV